MVKCLFSISNLISYFSLMAALSSVYFACQHDIHIMAGCWALSALFDNFDGKFAAFFKRSDLEKEFGKELDSLVDAFAFLLAPIVGLLILCIPNGPMLFFWLVGALFYLVAGITRLGYFNILNRAGTSDFIGIPTPLAGWLLSAALLIPNALPCVPLLLWILGMLMVTPIRIGRPKGPFFLIWILLILLVIFMHFSVCLL